MEKQPSKERLSEIDFLDENVKVNIEFAQDFEQVLQELSSDDSEAGVEKMRMLLGSVERKNLEEVEILLTGVMSMDEDAEKYYRRKASTEGVEVMSGTNISYLQNQVRTLQDGGIEFSEGYDFIGNIRTVLPDDLEKSSALDVPSLGDVESVISEYKEGVLSKDSPFIFGISEPDKEGKMQHSLFRIVGKHDEYHAVRLD